MKDFFLIRMGTLARLSCSGKSAQATVHLIFSRINATETLHGVGPGGEIPVSNIQIDHSA